VATDLRGARVGLYEVWGQLGEGGMSRVWLARHAELAVPVVLKTLRDPTPADAAERILNEARLMARIPSHRVVRAVDAGAYEGTPYLAQEYIDGLDLAELDQRRRDALGRGLPLWFVCRVVSEVADAMHSAHQTGVLHRDIKPSNILGSPQTGLRLGDFGLAVASARKNQLPSGTIRFVAPEVLLKGEPATRASDVYSLGATAFDLRYGRPPFVDKKELTGSEPVRFPAPQTAEEASFQFVVAGMLEREPARRVGSMTGPRRVLGALARQLRPKLPTVSPERGVFQVGPLRVLCSRGDIAEAEADGIVNSANDELQMTGGVARALRARGGDAIQEELHRIGPRALGEVVTTTGGALACKHVLHAVSAWREASCIARTTQRVLLRAEELGLRSLAIPALGTGVARVSPEACAYATASALEWHVLLGGTRLREIRFVLYDEETLELFIEELCGIFSGGSDCEDAGFSGSRADGSRNDDTELWTRPG
jgi:serine/threonine-protein kinase